MAKLITTSLTCVGLAVVLIVLLSLISAMMRILIRKPPRRAAQPPPRPPRSRKSKASGQKSAEPAPLDRTRIAAILRETEEVNSLLADAMKTEELPPPLSSPAPSLDSASASQTASPPAPVPLPETNVASAADIVPDAAVGPPPAKSNEPAQPSAPSASVPARYADFYAELLQKPRWPRTEAEALARRHGLMLGGALEAMNDWAFEAFGAPLLYEEGDQIVVDQSLL